MKETMLISFGLIALVAAAVIPKRMHLFEIIFIWFFLGYAKTNAYNFFLSLDEKLLVISLQKYNYWTYIAGSYLAIPSLIVIGLNALYGVRSVALKAAVIVLTAAALVAFECWEVASGVLERRHWTLVESLLFWLGMMLAATLLNGWFRRMMRREAGNR